MSRQIMQESCSHLPYSRSEAETSTSPFSGYVIGPSLAAAGGVPRKPARPVVALDETNPDSRWLRLLKAVLVAKNATKAFSNGGDRRTLGCISDEVNLAIWAALEALRDPRNSADLLVLAAGSVERIEFLLQDLAEPRGMPAPPEESTERLPTSFLP